MVTDTPLLNIRSVVPKTVFVFSLMIFPAMGCFSNNDFATTFSSYALTGILCAFANNNKRVSLVGSFALFFSEPSIIANLPCFDSIFFAYAFNSSKLIFGKISFTKLYRFAMPIMGEAEV